jgi:hypothetical protein
MNARKMNGWFLMDEAGDGGGGGGDAGGGGGGAGSAGDGGSAGDDAGGKGGKSILDGADDSAGGKGGDGGGGKGAGGKSILDGADDSAGGKGGGGKDGKGGEGGDGAGPTAEEVDAYAAKIRPAEGFAADGAGDGTLPAWDADAVRAVVPVLMKHKVSDAAAGEIAGAYAKHVSAQFAAARKAERDLLDGMRERCKERFKADLPRFAAEARRGGAAVFGKELFQRLAAVEAFGSDPDIVEALARVGRGTAADNAAGGRAGGAEEKSLAARMYGGIGRKK